MDYVSLAPSLVGFISKAFDWVGVAPLVPFAILAIWGRNLASRAWFFVTTLAVSVGLHHLWTTAIVLAEYGRHGALQAHPRDALWQFLRFDVQLYLIPFISLFVGFIIAKHWSKRAVSPSNFS